ncbi:hypothetical protein BH20ACI2_BH20ACI2_22880 [soil metagenome]
MTKFDLQTYILGGFECSTHRRLDGKRLDLIASTGHDRFASEDYKRLAEFGIGGARDGLRWHLIEAEPGKYDFSSVVDQMEAAEHTGVSVVWDLFHYGYPDFIDIFAPDFSERFAAYAAAFASFHRSRTGRPPIVVPVNEISFFSWIAGDIGQFYPFAMDRADELKHQLVKAAIAGIRAMRSIEPDTLVLTSEPVVHVTHRSEEPWFAHEAEAYRLAQYQALDMLTGTLRPDLGGTPDLIDVIGVNYYPHNQWYYPDREMLPFEDPNYRPFREIIAEVYERFDKPIMITETGTENERRHGWFRHVAAECRAASERGVDLRGICLYPILNHPGWVDDRHCHNGLWDYANDNGEREIFRPLAEEVRLNLGNNLSKSAAR